MLLALAGASLILGTAALFSSRWISAAVYLGQGLLLLSVRLQFGWNRRLAERGGAGNRRLLDTPPVRDSAGPAEPR